MMKILMYNNRINAIYVPTTRNVCELFIIHVISYIQAGNELSSTIDFITFEIESLIIISAL
jgi:hypothetical protein